jgi:hypothetical protein
VAPASAGEASMAHLLAALLGTGVRRLTRLMARLILSTVSSFFKLLDRITETTVYSTDFVFRRSTV